MNHSYTRILIDYSLPKDLRQSIPLYKLQKVNKYCCSSIVYFYKFARGYAKQWHVILHLGPF